jgi:hypothetical protein
MRNFGHGELASSPGDSIVKLAVLETPNGSFATSCAVVWNVIACVETVNDTEDSPAGTVTFVGTVAAGCELVKLIESPPAGALPLIVTSPVALRPPWTLIGETVRPVMPGGLITKDAPREVGIRSAVIAALVCVATGWVATVKLPVVAPAGIVTEAGAVAAVWLLLSAIVIPPDGAASAIVTVPVDVAPPNSPEGLRVRLVRAGGSSVRVALEELAKIDPEIFAATWAATS